LERDFDPGLAPLELAPQEMTRVFLNLFGNGFYATAKRQREADGAFRPVLKVTTRNLGDAVEVRVRDNGTGVAPEIRDKLFQPFVTTKPTGEGTGLGLSISYDIVTQQHGGTIEVDSREANSPNLQSAYRVPNKPHHRDDFMGFSILIVDDELDVAELFRQRFRRETRQGTYVLYYAASGRRRWVGSRQIEPTLLAVFSDINMPGMDGLELLGEIKQLRPDLPIIMVTAYCDDERQRQAAQDGAAGFFTKSTLST
jgi:CheY-like chemotaxis protein